MAIGVKVLERPIAETSYVRATLQGMGLTLSHIFREKVTYQYPEEKWSLSPRWRGTHRMLTTEDGKAKCVACGLCPTVCPANCIKLVPGEDDPAPVLNEVPVNVVLPVAGDNCALVNLHLVRPWWKQLLNTDTEKR